MLRDSYTTLPDATAERPTYNPQANAVAFWPGNQVHPDQTYHHTVFLQDEALTMGINVDLDDQGRVIMFEVLEASRIFHPGLLAEWEENLND